MFYTFPHTLLATDLVDAPHREEMTLSAGIVHQVDVLFQKNCAHYFNVQIFHGGSQLWPTNPGKTMKGDATVISFREFYELKGARNDLHALIWTTDATVYDYEVIIQVGILPKAVVMPLSFDELVRATAGM